MERKARGTGATQKQHSAGSTLGRVITRQKLYQPRRQRPMGGREFYTYFSSGTSSVSTALPSIGEKVN